VASALFAALLTAAQLPGETIRSPISGGSYDISKYEILYGEPIYWSLSFLVGPDTVDMPQKNQAISTRGRLSVTPRPQANPIVQLCDESLRRCLALDTPVPEMANEFFGGAAFRQGHDAEVTGAFTEGGFLFWRIDSALPVKGKRPPGQDRRLEELVRRPDRFLGRTVTVRGRFRGANLFRDFPEDGRPAKDGWVIRDGPFFVWITGRRPQGDGWRLDVASRADCVWNVEVDGVAELQGAVVSVKAKQVRLQERDPDASCAAAARR